MSRILSCESRDNGLLGEATACGQRATPNAGQVIAIGAGDALDQAEAAQACELAGDGRRREFVEDGKEMRAADTGDVEGRPLECAQETLFCGVEEIDAFDGLAADGTGLGEPIESPHTGREVVESGEEGEVTAITTEEDLAKVRQAVDRLFDRGKGAAGRPLRCSTLRWCLKEETSLLVVSRRRTRANLSYILIADLPKRCLRQVPSMQVAKRLPTS